MKRELTFQRLLLAFFIFIAGLICIRILYTGRAGYIFLAWNIFLAWIPFFTSSILTKIRLEKKWKQFILFFTWLIFFPNALYIVTDLIHLELETNVPKWFDAVLLFSSSIVGLMMAFVSLFRVEIYLSSYFKERTVTKMIIGILFLGSFGVYLGRFLRWNSWDIVRNPLTLASEVLEQFIFPVAHFRTWGITLILTILFYLLYLSVKKMPGYINQASNIIPGKLR